MKKKILMTLFLIITAVFNLKPEYALGKQNLLENFIKETQQYTNTTFIWWVPEEFWRVCRIQDPNIPEDQTEFMINSLSPYLLFLVAHGEFSASGKIRYQSEKELSANIRLIDFNKFSHYPLTIDKLGPSTKKLLKELRVDLTRNFNKLGKKMYLIVFPSRYKNGAKIIDTTLINSFQLKIGKQIFTWNLPFESLIPPVECPTCHQLHNWRYRFCPWDGAKLP